MVAKEADARAQKDLGLDKPTDMEDNLNNSRILESDNVKNESYYEQQNQLGPLAHMTNELKSRLETIGLNYPKIREIVSLPKSKKPLPSSYLDKQYISKHLDYFHCGGIVKIMPFEPKGTIGGKGGTFVMSEQDLNDIIKTSEMNVAKIEEKLGFDRGYLGDDPVVVKFIDAKGLRMPQGNELGADPNYWVPGGYTIGGIKEAVIDPAPESTYTFKHLFNQEEIR